MPRVAYEQLHHVVYCHEHCELDRVFALGPDSNLFLASSQHGAFVLGATPQIRFLRYFAYPFELQSGSQIRVGVNERLGIALVAAGPCLFVLDRRDGAELQCWRHVWKADFDDECGAPVGVLADALLVLYRDREEKAFLLRLSPGGGAGA